MWESLQIHLSIVLAAVIVARLSTRNSLLTTGLVFITCLLLLEGIVMGFIKKRLKRIQAEGLAFRFSVESLSLDEAREKALEAIAASVNCKGSSSDSSVVIEAPNTVKDIFSRYKRITFPAGDLLELGLREEGFIHVGRTYDDAELVVRMSDQGLFESEGHSLPSTDEQPDYPSLLHWIAKRVE